MPYGRKRSGSEYRWTCLNPECSAPHGRVERIHPDGKVEIPNELRVADQSVYHCMHCDWIWSGTWGSDGWLGYKIIGLKGGSEMIYRNTSEIANRKPRPIKRAAPEVRLKRGRK
jgi:hypothetical protein